LRSHHLRERLVPALFVAAARAADAHRANQLIVDDDWKSAGVQVQVHIRAHQLRLEVVPAVERVTRRRAHVQRRLRLVHGGIDVVRLLPVTSMCVHKIA
jgi:hypothetical protein